MGTARENKLFRPSTLRGVLRAVGLTPLLVVLACQPADRRPFAAESVDSAGVTVVSNAQPAWLQGESWSVSPDPTLRMGAVEGDPTQEFYRIADARRLPSGRIVVADGGSCELRFFDSAKNPLARAGRCGKGPGEFNRFGWIRMAADSLRVYDAGLRRVSTYTIDGRFIRLVTLPRTESTTIPTALGVFSDGSLLVESNMPFELEPGFVMESGQYYHLSPGGEILDSLGSFVSRLHFVTRDADGGMADRRVPFAPHAVAATFGDGFYFGDALQYDFRYFSSRGRLERIVRRALAPLPVKEKDRQDYIDGYTAASGDPAMRSRAERAFATIPLPATKPTYMGMRVSADGDVWLEQYRPFFDPTRRWDIFDSHGTYLGALSLPDRFNLLQVGTDFLLGVRQDQDGVEYVEMYGLRKRHPGADTRTKS